MEWLNKLASDIREVLDSKISSDNKIFWDGIANGYFNHEMELLGDDTLISRTSLYPRIMRSTIDKVIEHNGKNDKNEDSKIKLDFKFVSTMLPRHYLNYPRKLIAPHYRDDNKLFGYVINHRNDFTDNYRKEIEEQLLVSKDIEIKRISVTTENDDFLKTVDEDSGSNYFQQELFSYKEFIKDKDYSFSPEPIFFGKLFADLEKVENKASLFKHICGLEWEMYNSLKNKRYRNLSVYIKEQKYYKFNKINSNEQNDSIFDHFVGKLHSLNEAKMVILTPEDNSKAIEGTEFKTCPFDNKIKVGYDFGILNFRLGKKKIFSVVISAKLNMADSIVSIEIIHEKNNKDTFAKYIEAYEYLEEYANPINIKKNIQSVPQSTMKPQFNP